MKKATRIVGATFGLLMSGGAMAAPAQAGEHPGGGGTGCAVVTTGYQASATVVNVRVQGYGCGKTNPTWLTVEVQRDGKTLVRKIHKCLVDTHTRNTDACMRAGFTVSVTDPAGSQRFIWIAEALNPRVPRPSMDWDKGDEHF
ncbi:hypothetical protein [Amycolatopsis sp. NPDC059657]|uniref:hypothetical protein n=1 Tax=Amycolatopsis sp. NPDC059657 TaxID=3346899 RepID=UPI00366BF9D0